MEAINVSGLSFSYPGGRRILNDISFSVREGETFVIAGISGSGKTTLCNILAGIIPHSVKGQLSGRVCIFGESVTDKALPEASAMTAMVFQDADTQIVCQTVEDELAFVLENQCVAPRDIRKRVDATAATFGLSEALLLNPSKLSGGQKRILMIAATLIAEPRILILDEPMNSLDTDGRALVRGCIDKLHDEGCTIVVVEHDLELVRFADRWLVIEGGKAMMLDTPESLLRDRAKLRDLGLYL